MLYEYIFAFYGHSLYIDNVCHENDSLKIKFENSTIVTVSATTDLKTNIAETKRVSRQQQVCETLEKHIVKH